MRGDLQERRTRPGNSIICHPTPAPLAGWGAMAELLLAMAVRRSTIGKQLPAGKRQLVTVMYLLGLFV